MPVDAQRLEAELAADADVLRSLSENGDDPTMVRAVDVLFKGPLDRIVALKEAITALGWDISQQITYADGSEALEVQRHQTTDLPAIRQLTQEALLIADHYGVDYDGWGTLATSA